MEIRPLLSALWRNRTGPLLVAFQIAVTLAVLVNAAYVVRQRVELMTRPTGIDIENILVAVSVGHAPDYDHAATVRADLAHLNALPGVVAAAITHRVPQASGMSAIPFATEPGERVKLEPGSIFVSSEKMVDALGVKLIAGRMPHPEAVTPPSANSNEMTGKWTSEIVITRALAERLFPGGNALGKTLYSTLIAHPTQIVGIIERLQGFPASGAVRDLTERAALVPIIPPGPTGVYLVRTEPGRRDEIMAAIEKNFEDAQPGRFIERVETLADIADRTRAPARATAVILAVVASLVLAVTALGIFGLSAFNVTTRTRQIGTRRAVGARKFHILRYFLLENWLVTTTGVIAGCALALAIGVRMSLMFQSPRLPLYYLVGGVLCLWLVGLAAAWVPARRAAAISPAIATRTV